MSSKKNDITDKKNFIWEDLTSLGITNEKTCELFHVGTRENPSINVYKDKLSNVIFIKDHYVGENQYKEGSHWSYTPNLENLEWKKSMDCKRRVNSLREFYLDRNIADIGCGRGDFLIAIKGLTKSSIGIELQQSFINDLKSLDINCLKSISEIKDKSLDSIFLFHSFEHFPDPINKLTLLKKKLKKNGKIIIEVPSANDFLISVLKIKEFIAFTLIDQHLILHTNDSLNRFLISTGFNNVIIKGVQRHPLSNHLYWQKEKKPGGHTSDLSFLENSELNSAYERALSSTGLCDTIIAIASN